MSRGGQRDREEKVGAQTEGSYKLQKGRVHLRTKEKSENTATSGYTLIPRKLVPGPLPIYSAANTSFAFQNFLDPPSTHPPNVSPSEDVEASDEEGQLYAVLMKTRCNQATVHSGKLKLPVKATKKKLS